MSTWRVLIVLQIMFYSSLIGWMMYNNIYVLAWVIIISGSFDLSDNLKYWNK